MKLGEQFAQFSDAGRDHFENRLVGIRRHFLLEVSDAQGVHAPNLTLIGNRRAGEGAKERGLAGAVPPHETNPLARVDLQIHVRQERHMAIGQR